LDDERAARKASLGIWSTREFAARNAADPSLRQEIGLYELVEGRVGSVGVGEQAVFLNFGRRRRGDFTVIIAKAIAARLAEAGLPVDKLETRKVRVRGVIEESDGPAIRITDPANIELLDE
jgi:micrococcal nuclease